MSGLAKPAYTLEIDGVDDDSVVMLDIEIYKSQRGANWILRHKPYVKPTARHIPLGSDSYHPRSVHQSWPRAEMLRLHKRASLPQQSLLFRLAKITRFAYFGLDEQALDKCLDWSPGIKGICIPAHLQTGSLVAKQREMYIAIPYHEAFFGVQTAINKVVDKWRQHLIESTGISYSVKIAWSRASDPLQFKLRRCCKTANCLLGRKGKEEDCVCCSKLSQDHVRILLPGWSHFHSLPHQSLFF